MIIKRQAEKEKVQMCITISESLLGPRICVTTTIYQWKCPSKSKAGLWSIFKIQRNQCDSLIFRQCEVYCNEMDRTRTTTRTYNQLIYSLCSFLERKIREEEYTSQRTSMYYFNPYHHTPTSCHSIHLWTYYLRLANSIRKIHPYRKSCSFTRFE